MSSDVWNLGMKGNCTYLYKRNYLDCSGDFVVCTGRGIDTSDKWKPLFGEFPSLPINHYSEWGMHFWGKANPANIYAFNLSWGVKIGLLQVWRGSRLRFWFVLGGQHCQIGNYKSGGDQLHFIWFVLSSWNVLILVWFLKLFYIMWLAIIICTSISEVYTPILRNCQANILA